MFEKLVIKGCEHAGQEVLAEGIFKFSGGRRHGPTPNDTTAYFNIEWAEGTVQRNGFVVKVPNAVVGENHYDLVIEGDDLQTAKMGLRPSRGDKVYWAEQQVPTRGFNWLIQS